ncbi:acetyl-CoA carboxylase biotin carboxyl carrier protein [Chryseobacterium contaminans]|uniref:Biotin carboxyl carrier protein of acetyl-CoA carboxylase n=2 Tax=Chryseobacterium contaminans TaxID=1423959 RepID=A0A1M7DQ01_9FLAO|nr:acetyl-CoA carboxylase biotin carboxyl carrier protein [Chryseobacterium contaminans]
MAVFCCFLRFFGIFDTKSNIKFMDIKDIQNLIKFVSKAEVSEVKYKTKDFEITIKTPLAGSEAVYAQPAVYHTAPQAVAAPAPVATPAAAPAEKAEAASDDSKYVTIKSPMIGTFYRKPSPDKDVFVNVGDEVSAGKVVCVIEAMKLFNQIESEISGKIVKILVDDATPVEYDQPLFLVDPS